MAKGAKLKNCIVMQDTVIQADARLNCVIADKDCSISEGCFLSGTDKLPIVVPKGEHI